MDPNAKLLETYRAQAGEASGQTAASTPTEDPFITQMKAQLANQQGMISSAEQDTSTLLQKAQEGIKTSAAAGAAAVTSQFDRAIQDQTGENQNTLTGAQEAQRGFATNTALLTRIQETGDKSIKDLEQRKQELILQGQSAAAGQISQLQVQEAQMMVQNRQQAFQNLLAMAGLGIQSKGLQMQERQFQQSVYQFDRQMQMNLGETALKYGVDIKPGDTVESVIQRAMPRANEMQRLELEDMRLGMDYKRAQTALARAQAADIGNNSEDIGLLGSMMYQLEGTPAGDALLASVMKTSTPGAILQSYLGNKKPKVQTDSTLMQKAWALRSSGLDFANAKLKIENDTSIQNKSRAIDLIRNVFGKPEVQSVSSILFQQFSQNAATAASRYSSGNYGNQ